MYECPLLAIAVEQILGEGCERPVAVDVFRFKDNLYSCRAPRKCVAQSGLSKTLRART